MLNIRNILFPTDHSACAERAFRHAGFLSERHGAELHALRVTPVPAPLADAPLADPRSEGLKYFQEEVAERLHRKWEDEAAESGLPEKTALVTEQVKAPSVPEAILTYAEEQDVDLIVMGTHGRRGLRRFMLGSVAEEVVRHAPCDVLTVRGERPPEIERLLVSIDLSTHARELIQHALDLSTVCGATLDVLHVIEPAPPSLLALEELVADDFASRVRASARKRLEEMLDELVQPGMQSEVHLHDGRPAPTIAAVAEAQESDLIMMATRGHSVLDHVLLGSVTERVMRAAPCPVWTMRVDDEGRTRRACAEGEASGASVSTSSNEPA